MKEKENRMLVYVLLFTFCSIVASQYTNIETGLSRFGFDFYKECARTKTGDIIISPLSIGSVLGLLSEAANGTTYEEIKRGLNLNPQKSDVANQYQQMFNDLDTDKGASSFHIVNQIYVKKGHEISKNFSDVAKDKYKAGIEALDFNDAQKSATKINEFVESKTNKKIRQIIKASDLNADTDLVLLNAIYFKGDWEMKFNKSSTHKGPFHPNQNETIQVEFMTQKAKFFFGDMEDSAVLEMKYAKSNFSFIIVLPNNSTSLESIESRLTYEKLNKFLLNSVELIEVNVTIPKFGVESEIDLKAVFEKMEMGEMFKQKPDLAGLFEKPKDLRVSKAIHKAVIEVNEDGSEAAATTGLTIENRSGFTRSEIFVADRPFLYYIRDVNNKVILFSGRVQNLKSPYNSGASHLSMSCGILIAMMIFWAFTS